MSTVRKRNGQIENFIPHKAEQAIGKALAASGNPLKNGRLSKLVDLVTRYVEDCEGPVPVEDIQDRIEKILMEEGFHDAAKAFIIYRSEKSKLREEFPVDEEHLDLFKASSQYTSSPLSRFIHYRSYSKYIEEKSRRETWIESVDRAIDYLKYLSKEKLNDSIYQEIRENILKLNVLPSMRLMQMAGPAAKRNCMSVYNCTFLAIDSIQSFVEVLYILMAGTGVGYSVEREFTDDLPKIKRQKNSLPSTESLPFQPTYGTMEVSNNRWVFRIEDSTEGWADALKTGLSFWFDGYDLDFDFSLIRPRGSRLKTKGGYSSGPEPLMGLLEFARSIILSKQNRRLKPIECHDICTKIGDIVVVGGVRRAALISLFDSDDQEMMRAKFGAFYETHQHRSLANNSVVYEDKPDQVTFIKNWLTLMEAGTGEPGIFNRFSMRKRSPKRRKSYLIVGTNPCGEINLRNKQCCNLSEVVADIKDTFETLLAKIRLATIIGTIQSMATDFPYITKEWQKNCEEERLLGVSITNQMGCPLLVNDDGTVFRALREYAIEVNREFSELLGVNPSTAITCGKPSGTASRLVSTEEARAAGMHVFWAPFMVYNIRIAKTDPLFSLFKDAGYPYYQAPETEGSWVLPFPVKAPQGAITRKDWTAVQQLEYWLKAKRNYAEHSISFTCYVGKEEWIQVAEWVMRNFDEVTGVSFLPKSDFVYQLSPYQEITEEEYTHLVETLPEINYTKLPRYEKSNQTTGNQEFACVSGSCELV